MKQQFLRQPREPFNAAVRGYHVAYRRDEINHCPGCGKSQWHIGRASAECAFCETVLPLSDPEISGAGTFLSRGGKADA